MRLAVAALSLCLIAQPTYADMQLRDDQHRALKSIVAKEMARAMGYMNGTNLACRVSEIAPKSEAMQIMQNLRGGPVLDMDVIEAQYDMGRLLGIAEDCRDGLVVSMERSGKVQKSAFDAFVDLLSQQ